MTDTRRAADPTIDENVVAHFAALAAQWWDPRGKMGVLHKFNPVRLAFIKETICRYSGRDRKRSRSQSSAGALELISAQVSAIRASARTAGHAR